MRYLFTYPPVEIVKRLYVAAFVYIWCTNGIPYLHTCCFRSAIINYV